MFHNNDLKLLKQNSNTGKNNFSIEPHSFRSPGVIGELLWFPAVHDKEPFGIFCRREQSGDKEREGKDIFFGGKKMLCYRENENPNDISSAGQHVTTDAGEP